MIGGDRQDIARFQRPQNLRQESVKLLESPGIPGRVVAVSVKHVEIDQGGEDQPPVHLLKSLQGLEGDLHVAAGGKRPVDAVSGKDIVDLTHPGYLVAGIVQAVKQGGRRRRQGDIVAPGGALEVAGCADERTGNHPSHRILPGEDPASDLTDPVKFRDRDDLLVGGDLKHAVGRGVDDGRAGLQVLPAQFLDDLGA